MPRTTSTVEERVARERAAQGLPRYIPQDDDFWAWAARIVQGSDAATARRAQVAADRARAAVLGGDAA